MTRQPIQDSPPASDVPTAYDRTHARLYLRLLDAHAEGADWREIAQVLFDVSPISDPACAHRIYRSHLERAKWLSSNGYLHLLTTGAG